MCVHCYFNGEYHHANDDHARGHAGLCTLLALAACGSNHAPEELNQMPSYLGTITRADYDGKTNDLLTAGLGKTGLAGAAPAYANVEQPTPLELRRNAIYANYRAVLDIAANSGYGTLYGPNVDASGNAGTGEGMVAGSEYIAYADDGTGKKNVTLMVQVPASFDPDHACIVTGTSSGSRGIYGAIGSSGEWGLKKGCAVAYADKGSGTGLYVFEDDSVNLQNGVRAGRVAAGKNALFAPDLSDADRLAWAGSQPEPHRLQACALAAESGEGLGQGHLAGRRDGVLRVERALRRAGPRRQFARRAPDAEEHHHDRLEHFQRRRLGLAGGGTG